MISKVEVTVACVLMAMGMFIYCREINKDSSDDFKSTIITMSGFMIGILGAMILQYPDLLRL